MRQQINLHQPIFRRERKAISAVMVATTLGVLALALIAFSMYTAQSVAQLENEVAKLTEQQTKQQEQLTKVGETLSRQARRSDVEARVKSLTTTLSERTQALQVLQSGAAGQTSGFATRMEALARRHVNGLWIDRLAMSGTQSSMSISGGSLDADIVPVYLRSLSSETVLSGTRFDDFVIERTEKGSGIRFRAGSRSLPVKQQTPGT
ncbi:MAG TPA: PilN domain-containing protein [Steroidobacteraceae bacterium]|nr:PilN domain-containing protein [Steroidobacteraceae bacterium]